MIQSRVQSVNFKACRGIAAVWWSMMRRSCRNPPERRRIRNSGLRPLSFRPTNRQAVIASMRRELIGNRKLKMRYLVPFGVIRNSMKLTAADDTLRVDMTYDDIVNIIKSLLICVDVDEEWYCRTYPDVGAAISAGDWSSAKAHFIENGYFEGRLPFQVKVDDEWYVRAYGDVAQGIKSGVLLSPQDHFDRHGYDEGRFPFAGPRMGRQ